MAQSAGNLYITYLSAYTVKASTANIKWDCLDNTILLPYTIYILLLCKPRQAVGFHLLASNSAPVIAHDFAASVLSYQSYSLLSETQKIKFVAPGIKMCLTLFNPSIGSAQFCDSQIELKSVFCVQSLVKCHYGSKVIIISWTRTYPNPMEYIVIVFVVNIVIFF